MVNASNRKRTYDGEWFRNKNDINHYAAHRQSLEMAFIDAMIVKHVRGPTTERFTNR